MHNLVYTGVHCRVAELHLRVRVHGKDGGQVPNLCLIIKQPIMAKQFHLRSPPWWQQQEQEQKKDQEQEKSAFRTIKQKTVPHLRSKEWCSLTLGW